MAYSLFGTFNVSIPAICGEGNRAIGRFLEHILVGLGDAIILACAAARSTTHRHGRDRPHRRDIQFILPDFSLAVALYDHLHKLPSPTFTASRLGLPCIAFSTTQLDDASGSGSGTGPRFYRAAMSALGEAEIKIRDDLFRMNGPLIHLCISSLLNQEFSYNSVSVGWTARALRLIARLRQPFVLLLEVVARARYRRVATDCLIVAQVREGTSLTELIDGVRTTVDIQ